MKEKTKFVNGLFINMDEKMKFVTDTLKVRSRLSGGEPIK